MRFPKWYSLFLHTDCKKVMHWWGLGLIGIDLYHLSGAEEGSTFWQSSCFKLFGFSATVSRLKSRKQELIILHRNALLVCLKVLVIVLGEGSFCASIQSTFRASLPSIQCEMFVSSSNYYGQKLYIQWTLFNPRISFFKE